MNDGILENNESGAEAKSPDTAELLEKIEDAYKLCKLSEMYLKDVTDDYGKWKIARLRLEFARHQLATLIKEAKSKGIKWDESEMVGKLFYPDS